MSWRLAVLLTAAAALCACQPARSQPPSTRVKDLAQGKFLVAGRELMDPNFAETVVLLFKHGEDGAAGLIVNRRTKLPLARVLDGMKDLKRPSDPVFLGGPVQVTGALALVRSRSRLKDAEPVFGEVYLTSSKEHLEQSASSGEEPSTFRVYLGYAGWGSGQLEREVRMGSWHIFPGDASLVFDAEPGTLWDRMIQRAETRVARCGPRQPDKITAEWSPAGKS